MRHLGSIALFLLLDPSAWAFHPPARFDQPATEGGGAGNFFTGSPRFKRWDCSICHIEAEGRIAAVLGSEPGDLAQRGVFDPEQVYVLGVELYGEHRGLGSRANINTFIANVEDDEGRPQGRFAFDPEVFVGFFDRSLVAARGLEARTSWTLEWIAPPAGTGPVALHLAMLDGDGAGDAAAARTDAFGDDLTVAALRLCEAGMPCEDPLAPEEPLSPASCRVAAAGRSGSPLAVLPFCLGLALLARRRLRLACLALLVAAGSCNDPVVPAECPGRICGTIGGDGDADPDDAGPGRDAAIEPGQDASVPACNEDWFCGPWEASAGSDEATRSCVDRNETGTSECKPPTGPVTLPELDMAFFRCEVEPILDRGCSMMGCHGTNRPLRVFSRGRLRNSEVVQRVDSCLKRGEVDLAEAGSATVMCEGWLPHTDAEWKKNFDSARAFLMGVGSPEDSELLRQPVVGGMPHEGVHLFDRGDADYQTILEWLGGATREECDPWPN
ncbi:MAG: hypothetical protein HYY06_12200 [Deltaproteobacteria bacterium]|nr:hypothetical protein [Deltaproteobacteria bacterium]